MRWMPGQTSGDIEDRRDSSGGGGFGGGGFGGIHLGLGGTLLVLVLSFVFRQNLFDAFTPTAPTQSVGSADRDAAEAPQVQFVSFVLDDVQHTWERTLPATNNIPYRHAKLVLFRDVVDSACGM